MKRAIRRRQEDAVASWPRRRAVTASGQLAAALALHTFALARTRPRLLGDRVFEPVPSTIIVFKHSSDLDLPVLTHTLFGPHAWKEGAGRITFVARADLYQRGFLALYFSQLGPLRPLFSRLNVGNILHELDVLPANVDGPLLVADWLEQLAARFGDATALADLLSPEGIGLAQRFGVDGRLTLAAARRWRRHRWLEQPAGAELVSAPAARTLRLAAARRAKAQLDAVADRLAEGSMLLVAPEGGLSPDGSLKPFRGVLHRLLRRVPDCRVLPVGISYDLPRALRPRVLLRIGEPLCGLGALARPTGEQRIRSALMRETTITLAHVAGEAIRDRDAPGSCTLPLSAFSAALFHRCSDLARAGLAVDERLLTPAPFERELSRFLRRAGGHGLSAYGGVLRVAGETARGPVTSLSDNPLGFAANELASILREAGSS